MTLNTSLKIFYCQCRKESDTSRYRYATRNSCWEINCPRSYAMCCILEKNARMNGTMTMSDMTMGCEAKLVTGSTACLERLQREALNCLNTFPNKVIELNSLMENYMPASIKTSSDSVGLIDTTRRLPRSRSLTSTIREYEITSNSDIDDKYTDCRVDLASVTSYYSLGSHDCSRTRHGICKRKYYRLRGLKGSTIRRRPGPLGQLLVFIASKLAICTKAMVISPSLYIIDRIISIFFQRRELKNAQCGPSANWSGTMSCRVTALKEDDTRIGNFIAIIRPAAVLLIADTTTLKRWLQAVALTTKPPSVELINATRTTETIDCWAYELFFQLKYLQVNRSPSFEKVSAADDSSKIEDDVTHINLWHRLVQLRDNYIILYETLYDEPKIHLTMPPQ